MEQKLQQLKDIGLNTEDGLSYTGGADKYISAVAKYVSSYEDNVSEVEKLLDSGKLNRYMVKVHAMKSNSKMIGASGLFSDFLSLELAAQKEDMDFITANHAAILKKYGELIEALRPVVEKEADAPAAAISAAEAADTAEKLLTALDDFDDDLSAELAAKLSGYPFDSECMKQLDSARKYIGDFMYDEAAEIIRSICSYIK